MNKLRIGVAVAALALSVSAFSQTIVYNFTEVLTGGTPTGGPTYATLTVEDFGMDTVRMSLSHSGTALDPQFLGYLNLNIDPYVGGYSGASSDPTVAGFEFGLNSVTDAAGRYDMRVNFNKSNSGDRFEPGETVSWTISGTSLTAQSFAALAPGNQGQYALLHVQGIPGSNPDSSKIYAANPVPEPGTMIALGAGALAMLARRRKKA